MPVEAQNSPFRPAGPRRPAIAQEWSDVYVIEAFLPKPATPEGKSFMDEILKALSDKGGDIAAATVLHLMGVKEPTPELIAEVKEPAPHILKGIIEGLDAFKKVQAFKKAGGK